MQNLSEKEKDKLKQYPPIDKVMAVILERKFATRMTWADVASGTGTTGEYLRHLVSQKRTEDWPRDILNAVCKKFGISIKITMEDLYNLDDW